MPLKTVIAKAMMLNARHAIPVVVCLSISVASALGLVYLALKAGLHLSFDVNEGWNAYHAQAAVSGGALYPGPESFFINNYPPLSFYVVGWLGETLGDNIFAGRILSMVAALACAGLIGCTLGGMGTGWREAWFGGVLFLAVMLLTSHYVGMNDPQLLGQAIGMGGLALLMQGRRDTGTVACVALAFSLAFFVKHNLVIMPIASTIWLWLYDRRSGFLLGAFGLIFLACGITLFRWVYGIDLLTAVNNARGYSLLVALASTIKWMALPATLAAVLIALVLTYPREKHVVFCAVYSVLAIAVGGYFLGGDGVDRNVMFDANIALCLSAGLAAHRFAPRTNAPFVIVAIPLGVALAIGERAWLHEDYWHPPWHENAALSEAAIGFLARTDGPAICETLALCYWAGKPLTADILSGAYTMNTATEKAFVRLLDTRQIAVIQVTRLTSLSLSVGFRDAVFRRYVVDNQNQEFVLLRRR